jgi:hypothetical protein
VARDRAVLAEALRNGPAVRVADARDHQWHLLFNAGGLPVAAAADRLAAMGDDLPLVRRLVGCTVCSLASHIWPLSLDSSQFTAEVIGTPANPTVNTAQLEKDKQIKPSVTGKRNRRQTDRRRRERLSADRVGKPQV